MLMLFVPSTITIMLEPFCQIYVGRLAIHIMMHLSMRQDVLYSVCVWCYGYHTCPSGGAWVSLYLMLTYWGHPLVPSRLYLFLARYWFPFSLPGIGAPVMDFYTMTMFLMCGGSYYAFLLLLNVVHASSGLYGRHILAFFDRCMTRLRLG
jgi:hypothetical protein